MTGIDSHVHGGEVVGRMAQGSWPGVIEPDAALVHLGQSAMVLSAPAGLRVVTSDTAGLMPGGLSLPQLEFVQLRERVRTRGTQALVSWWRTYGSHVAAVDLHLGVRAQDPAAVAAMATMLRADSCLPEPIPTAPIRARAAAVVHAAYLPGTDRDLGRELTRLVGAGPGTTPTGDDVIAGVLAGLRARGAAAAVTRIADLLPDLLPRTTRASAHYLSAACRGEVGEHVHQLVAALADPARVAAAIERARRWGASSGIDLAHGLVAATSFTTSTVSERIA